MPKLARLKNIEEQNRRIPSENPPLAVRIGVVGCGYWGPNLIRNFHEIPEATVASLCDLRPERLKPFARKFPGAKLTSRYEDLISDSAIDAVVIATPISTHYELAKKALLAGKHVLVEKPLTATARQGHALVRLAARFRKILMAGHTFEYNPAVRKVAELLKSGECGRLYYIDAVRVNLGLHPSDGQNVLWDLAPHDISIILHWVEKLPLRVSAWGRSFVHKEMEDVVFVRLEFPDGVLAHLHLSWLAPSKIRRITLVGDRKMVIYDDLEAVEKIKVADCGANLDPSESTVRVHYRMGNIVSPRVEVTEPLFLECSHFVHCILENKTPETHGERGVQIVRVLEAADRSLRQGGRAVRV